jgi:hypothetical protein
VAVKACRDQATLNKTSLETNFNPAFESLGFAEVGKLTLAGGGEQGVDGEEDLLVVDVEVDQVTGDPVHTATPRSSLHFIQRIRIDLALIDPDQHGRYVQIRIRAP